ncbi:Zn-ribbon-containing, putative RNA-binding protein [Hartmannibacter diazotrophicus]|uniref:Zn-ribbon-containing, putative RNA-binding protein n=1 Tax=Hartmannibacter diazotrophicus TaxID=1482074 RepID=A0A2C9D335_9HYPH|nr:DciA family protein [Hartmannibacter diazotrophicus]SON54676.1 Zn-ribbon-containing, putative RNA-binding protein [Hartmannibacter diazotrophicus]
MSEWQENQRRRKGPVPIADMIPGALSPACRKRGFNSVELVAHWPDIVGDIYAETTQPDRITWPRLPAGVEVDAAEPATLTLRASGTTALRLQHDLPRVIERINMFFGWRAVGRIRIVQMPLQPSLRRQRPKLGALPEEKRQKVHEACAGIEDDGLRAAVERLGRALASPRRP